MARVALYPKNLARAELSDVHLLTTALSAIEALRRLNFTSKTLLVCTKINGTLGGGNE